MTDILLVDDDKNMHILIKRIVEKNNYVLHSAFDGEEGLKMLETVNPSLLLLDVMLPEVNGFDVCKKVRQNGKQLPIIFLSAKGDIVDKSIGFKAGGDDYVVKPFSGEELLLRIESLIRRHNGELVFSSGLNCGSSFKVGDLEILFNKYEVKVRGEQINISAKEFEILALMAGNPGRVFTRGQIYDHIWGRGSSVDQNSITVFMRKIREKIEDNPSEPEYIKTVWRVGYKFDDHM